MGSSENEALIRRIAEAAWNQGDVDLIDAHYAPEDDSQSLAQLKRAVLGFRAAFPDLLFTIEQLLASDDIVMCRWTLHGTHRGSLHGISASDTLAGNRFSDEHPLWLVDIPPTGQRVEIEGVSLFHLAGGQIIRVWTMLDQLGLLHQLGAMPLPLPGRQPGA